MSEVKMIIGSIFIDEEGNEVEILKWEGKYVDFVYCGTKLICFTSKNKFLKEFEPKDEE